MFQHMFWRVCCLWLILGMWPGCRRLGAAGTLRVGQTLEAHGEWPAPGNRLNQRASCGRQTDAESRRELFRLQLTQAAKQLDEAYFASLLRPTTSDFQRMIVAQRLEVKPVALDQEEPKVQLRLKPLYQVDTQDGAPKPSLENTTIELALLDGAGQSRARLNCSGQRLADGMVWQIEDLDEGDYQLELRATTPAESVALRTCKYLS